MNGNRQYFFYTNRFHMHKTLRLALLTLIISVSTVASAKDGDSAAQAAFKKLLSLNGVWKGVFSNGREHTVTYRTTAGGTVLVETWALSPTHESMTIYHMDGTRLIATHYCPQGNQPRLEYVAAKDPNQLEFKFFDGSNLGVLDRTHQHVFRTKILPDGTIRRGEIYVANGLSIAEADKIKDEEVVVYSRLNK